MAQAADPVAAALVKQALPKKGVCSACGRSDKTDPSVLVRARVAVLDRAGVGPHSTSEVDVTAKADDKVWMHYMPPERLLTMKEWIEEARATMAADLSVDPDWEQKQLKQKQLAEAKRTAREEEKL